VSISDDDIEKRREKQREYHRRWRAAHPEASREANRESMRKWREANPGANRESMRKWREANPEANRESMRKRAADPAYRAAHPERYRKDRDPNTAYGPATLDLETGQWVRFNGPIAIRKAPDTSLAARVAAAIIVIESRLEDEEWEMAA
jgi:hypothetical protein